MLILYSSKFHKTKKNGEKGHFSDPELGGRPSAVSGRVHGYILFSHRISWEFKVAMLRVNVSFREMKLSALSLTCVCVVSPVI